MEKNPKRVVQLRTYQGRELDYDANGKIKNPMSVIKIKYNTVEWSNFMRWLPVNGYCSVEVAAVIDLDTDKPISDTKDIEAEVKLALEGEVKDNRTPEQIQIDELKQKIEEITGGKKKKKKVKAEKPKVVVATGEYDMKALRAEYRTMFGKGVGPKWSASTIAEKIAAGVQN